MTTNCRKWLEQQGKEFMRPYAYYFRLHEAQEELLPQEWGPDDIKAGWYSRLSAPGYLDCTDWQGPYATEDEAFQALYDTYGDD